MTDAEFIGEVRRGLMLIMRAFIKRFGLDWADFLPRGVSVFPAIYTAKTKAVDETLKSA